MTVALFNLGPCSGYGKLLQNLLCFTGRVFAVVFAQEVAMFYNFLVASPLDHAFAAVLQDSWSSHCRRGVSWVGSFAAVQRCTLLNTCAQHPRVSQRLPV